MALNLSDPGAILGAYESIIDVGNGNNWLLLKYSNYDELFLADHGSGGLRELKSKVEDIDRIFIAFYRREVGFEPGFIIINYIPPSISGVKRARALVHSRRVGTIFKQHQTTLTVEDISHLTSDAINHALDPEIDGPRESTSLSYASSHTSESDIDDHNNDNNMGRTASQPIPEFSSNKYLPSSRGRTESPPLPSVPSQSTPAKKQKQRPVTAPLTNIEPIRRAFSENTSSSPPPSALKSAPIEPVRRAISDSQNPGYLAAAPPPPPKPTGMLSTLMRFRKGTRGMQTQEPHVYGVEIVDTPPPPPPPSKDRSPPPSPLGYYSHYSSGYCGHNAPDANISDFAVISHAGHDYRRRSEEDRPVIVPLTLSGKWAQEPLDFEERKRRRREAEKKRKEEEQLALRQEMRRQEEAKRRREEQRREEIEEEERKRMDLEDVLRRATQERRMKEQMEKHEEERKRIEAEERKRLERERRLEEHRRLDEWRREQMRLSNEAARKVEETRKKEEFERKRKIQLAEAKVRSGRAVEELTTGWVTMQTHDSVTWKRRFYKFAGTTMYLYRSPNDLQEFLDKIEVRGRLRGLREWKEGYEELEAIPFSFAMEFNVGDERGVWSMYADSEEEKYKLLGLLHHAAGL